MGIYFGFSDFSVSQYLELIKPILKSSLSQNSSVCSRLFSNQSEFDEIFKNVETIIIDVSEVPTERPDNKKIQENRYSGKKNFIL
jgi:phage-related protein